MVQLSLPDVLMCTGVCSFIGLAMYTCFCTGMIFGYAGDFVRNRFPEALKKPLVDCPICMSFWYGLLYNIFFLLTNPQVSVAGSILSIGLTSWMVGFYKTNDDETDPENKEPVQA